ncbi:MAG: hypothetical protein GWN84_18340 [Gammaproteobacteria bacterium]|nr:hypothetical protein [Gammaproteobacteria bacterium]NIR84792.1 hypothetical protein [Gammaproteobacteria bacterium]NIR91311.1 hypothetical protein [Gammaproteobacteria bacterium]NIU05839.1 hypothetical protein [Gammaproteobacteria bacterium]NIV76499.1 hypothetical protein [Gammaproteobacteria bacterium]
MASRWWIYQRERFPVLTYAALAGVLAYSATSFSVLARGASTAPGAALALPAALGVFLFFVLMRVADELKDYADDLRYRAYRPVPRGLVKRTELACIGALAAIGQLVTALVFDPRIMPILALAWTYLGLMTAEFFVPRWLKARPFAYLVSHMPMVGFITLYASAHDWLPRQGTPPAGLGWLLMASVFLGVLLEIARKIRAPADEERGVDTYTAVWGRPQAVIAWGAALVLAGASGCAAAGHIGFASGFASGLAVLGIPAVLVAYRFLRRPVRAAARGFEALSGVATLAAYAALGPLTLLLA